eukprot:g901.t1
MHTKRNQSHEKKGREWLVSEHLEHLVSMFDLECVQSRSEEIDLSQDLARQLKDETTQYGATNSHEVKRSLQRLSEKMIVKCLDDRSFRLKDALSTVYELADQASTNHRMQKRKIALFDMLRLMLCLSRQPARWSQERAVKDRQARRRFENEDLDVVGSAIGNCGPQRVKDPDDPDLEAWKQDFKNNNEGTDVFFHLDADILSDSDASIENDPPVDRPLLPAAVRGVNIENDSNCNVDDDEAGTKLKLPPLATLPLQNLGLAQQWIRQPTRQSHSKRCPTYRASRRSRHNVATTDRTHRRLELFDRLAAVARDGVSRAAGFKDPYSAQWIAEASSHNRPRWTEAAVVWEMLRAFHGIPGPIVEKRGGGQRTTSSNLGRLFVRPVHTIPFVGHLSSEALLSATRRLVGHANTLNSLRSYVDATVEAADRSVVACVVRYPSKRNVLARSSGGFKYCATAHAFASGLKTVLVDFERCLGPWIVSTSRLVHRDSLYASRAQTTGLASYADDDCGKKDPPAITLLALCAIVEPKLELYRILEQIADIFSHGAHDRMPPCVISSRLLDSLALRMEREAMLHGVRGVGSTCGVQQNAIVVRTLLKLFQATLDHYLRGVDIWMLTGKLFDPHDELFLFRTEEKKNEEEEEEEKKKIRGCLDTYAVAIRKDGVPRLLQSVVSLVLETGSGIRVLKRLAVARYSENEKDQRAMDEARVLAARYVDKLQTTEPLIDCFRRESADLLGGPARPSGDDGTDGRRAIAMRLIFERGILRPIRERHAATKAAVATLLKDRLNLAGHLSVLRAVFFFGREGDLLGLFLRAVFDELGGVGANDFERSSSVALTTILRSCLDSGGSSRISQSRHGGDSMRTQSDASASLFSHRFTASLSFSESTEKEDDKRNIHDEEEDEDNVAVPRLRIAYNPGWPLNQVVTRECLVMYDSVFSFLLQIKRARHFVIRTHLSLLKETRRRRRRRGAVSSTSRRSTTLYERISKRSEPESFCRVALRDKTGASLHAMTAEILHVVEILHAYMMGRAHDSWDAFLSRMLQTRSVEEMRTLHVFHLRRICSHCLLSSSATAVLQSVRSLLDAAISFAGRVEAYCSTLEGSVASSSAMESLQALYRRFRADVRFLVTTLAKILENESYASHLKGALLRLNYNGDFDYSLARS